MKRRWFFNKSHVRRNLSFKICYHDRKEASHPTPLNWGSINEHPRETRSNNSCNQHKKVNQRLTLFLSFLSNWQLFVRLRQKTRWALPSRCWLRIRIGMWCVGRWWCQCMPRTHGYSETICRRLCNIERLRHYQASYFYDVWWKKLFIWKRAFYYESKQGLSGKMGFVIFQEDFLEWILQFSGRFMRRFLISCFFCFFEMI